MSASYDFEAMSVEALWGLHEQLRAVLTAKMTAHRQQLDDRLRDLDHFAATSQRTTTALRPLAAPIYRNPDQPSQVWSGRGLRPRWLVLKLAAGHTLSDFRVDGGGHAEDGADRGSAAQQRA